MLNLIFQLFAIVQPTDGDSGANGYFFQFLLYRLDGDKALPTTPLLIQNN